MQTNDKLIGGHLSGIFRVLDDDSVIDIRNSQLEGGGVV